MKANVLISAAGGAGTIEVIRALKETGRYRVIAMDASSYAFGLKLADQAYLVPTADSPAFPSRLSEILVKEKIEFAIPLVDEEIPIFHRLAAQHAVTVLAPSPAFCAMALDKFQTVQALAAAGIPVAETWSPADRSEIVYPAVLKPRQGRGSRGVVYVESASALDRALSASDAPHSVYVVQRRLLGREFTVSVTVTRDGRTLAVVPKEVLSKRGITLVGVTRQVNAIAILCRRIQEALRADGPFNVQLMLDASGVARVFEINPRFSTTIGLTMAAGVNEADLLIRDCQGSRLDGPVPFTADLLMVRYHTQVYVPEQEWSEVTAGGSA